MDEEHPRDAHAPYPYHSHHKSSQPRHPHEGNQSRDIIIPQPLTYLAPPPLPQFSLLDEPFMALIEETRSILASVDFARVLEVCLDRATEVLFEGLEKNVFGRGTGASPGTAREGDGAGAEAERIRLAGLLPGLARWSQLALNGLPNELVDVRLLSLPFLKS